MHPEALHLLSPNFLVCPNTVGGTVTIVMGVEVQ